MCEILYIVDLFTFCVVRESAVLYSCADRFVFVLLLLSIGFNGNALVVDIYLCALYGRLYFAAFVPFIRVIGYVVKCISSDLRTAANEEAGARQTRGSSQIMFVKCIHSTVCSLLESQVFSTVFVVLSNSLAYLLFYSSALDVRFHCAIVCHAIECCCFEAFVAIVVCSNLRLPILSCYSI